MHPKIDDSGEVRVLAKNAHGEAQATAQLRVQKKPELPRFLSDMDDKQAMEGDNVRFTAKIEAHPEPEVQWTLNGEPISAE